MALVDSAGVGPSFEEANWLWTFASLLGSRGKAEDELAVARRSREMAALTIPPGRTAHAQLGILIAEALSALGDTAQAHAEAREVLAKLASMPSGNELNAFIAEWRYARILRRQGPTAEAERAARRQYETGMASATPYLYCLADTYYLLGGVLSDRGKYAEAERHLLEAFRVARDHLGAQHARTLRAERELAQLYLRWKRPAEAATYLAMLSGSDADPLRRKVAAEPPRK